MTILQSKTTDNIDERNWKGQTKNGRESCVHGWEDSILLKCPYYPKQFVDSVQSLSKI
jgi:hypothetical protein